MTVQQTTQNLIQATEDYGTKIASEFAKDELDINYVKSKISQIDNTSDMDKPVSSRQQIALNLKMNKTDVLSTSYDLAFGIPLDFSKPTNVSKVVGMFLATRDIYLPGNYGDSIAVHRGAVDANANADSYVLILRLNQNEFGQIHFSNLTYQGVFISSNSGDPLFISRNDVIDILTSPTISNFCSNVAVTLVGCSLQTLCISPPKV